MIALCCPRPRKGFGRAKAFVGEEGGFEEARIRWRVRAELTV